MWLMIISSVFAALIMFSIIVQIFIFLVLMPIKKDLSETSSREKFLVTKEHFIIVGILISVYAVLPLVLTILKVKRKRWKYIAKKDIFLAWNSVASLNGIALWTWISVSQLVKHLPFEFSATCSSVFLVSWFFELVASVYYIRCSGRKVRPKLMKDVEKLLSNIKKTGPSLVRGQMYVTRVEESSAGEGGTITITTTYWDWSWWEQFQYKSWRNSTLSGFEEAEDILRSSKLFLLILKVDIVPENESTLQHYRTWLGNTDIKWSKWIRNDQERERMCLEEIITSSELALCHKPKNTTASLQLPCHASTLHPKQRFL